MLPPLFGPNRTTAATCWRPDRVARRATTLNGHDRGVTRSVVDQAVLAADLVGLREPVRRYLARVVSDEHELDDLVQETLLRVWEVRGRVERRVAVSYAVATARNLVQSRERAAGVHRRHAHRLHEPATVESPEQVVLREEERAAAAAALAALHEPDARLLVEAAGEGPEAGASSARRSRLAKARARARVDYLLVLRRLYLPTPRCRPVLDALSSGDRREQERRQAGAHLLACPTCTSCAPALLTRARGAFGIVLLPLFVLLELVRQWPRTTATVATGAAAAGVAAALLSGGPAASPRPAVSPRPAAASAAPTASAPGAAAPTASAPGAAAPGTAAPSAAPTPTAAPPLVLSSGQGFGADLSGAVGRTVVATRVLVRSVPADEGFFVGPDDASQLFVRLATAGESPVTVTAGQLVSFSGTVQAVTPAVADSLTSAEGRGQVQDEAAYLDVPLVTLAVEPAG